MSEFSRYEQNYTYDELISIQENDPQRFHALSEAYANGVKIDNPDTANEIAERMFNAAPLDGFTNASGEPVTQYVDADGYIIDPPAPYCEPGRMPTAGEVVTMAAVIISLVLFGMGLDIIAGAR